MNTKIIALILAAAAAAGSSASAGDAANSAAAQSLDGNSPAPACCAVTAKPQPGACCAEIASEAPLSARSLYQLEATWTNDEGAAVQLATFRGKPVVLAMFFASCTYACPMLVNDMQRIRDGLPANVRASARFVLVTFDTERDTPAALKAFRERSGINEAWTLVRGDAASVQDLAMLLGVKFKRDAAGQFAHSNQITVLNGEGEIAHQRNGLMGDVSETVKAVILAAQ